MSAKHPTVKEILANSKGLPEMRKHFGKSYLGLARTKFVKAHKHYPTTEDSQELYDIYEKTWRDYYIDKPLREQKNKELGTPIWNYGKSFGIDVYSSMCRFLEFLYPEYKTRTDGSTYLSNSAADIMEERNIEFMETYIIENNLLEIYKQFVRDRKNILQRYHKPTYTDWSSMAYNGVADDL